MSLDFFEGREGLPAAKRLLKSYSGPNGISMWDASSIFFEMHGLDVDDEPSPRAIVLLYAADLSFRLRWEILPALKEGKSIVAAPYVETVFAFGAITGLPKRWMTEVLRFAPKAKAGFRANGTCSGKLGTPTSGFVEFCSDALKRDLRPGFTAYFDELERRGRCRTI